MMTGTLPILILLCVTTICAGDWVVWEYDLRSAPPGWEFEHEWVFSSEGVRMDEYVGSPYTSEWGHIYSLDVVIPEGCDSIILHIEQDLSVTSSGNGYAGAELDYRLNGAEWLPLLNVGIWYQSTVPIHEDIPAAPGQVLDLHFEAYAGKGNDMYPGWGSIDWLLYDLTLTFYGEQVSFEQTTWGAIKGAM